MKIKIKFYKGCWWFPFALYVEKSGDEGFGFYYHLRNVKLWRYMRDPSRLITRGDKKKIKPPGVWRMTFSPRYSVTLSSTVTPEGNRLIALWMIRKRDFAGMTAEGDKLYFVGDPPFAVSSDEEASNGNS